MLHSPSFTPSQSSPACGLGRRTRALAVSGHRRRSKLAVFLLLAGVFFLGLAQASFADVVMGWNFGTTTPNAAATSGTAVNFTTGNFGIAQSFGTVSTPISTTSASNNSGASGQENIGQAVNNAAFGTGSSPYFSVTITPASGDFVTIKTFDFAIRSTATGATTYQLYSSVDNYTTPILATTGSNAANSVWTFKTNGTFNVTGAVNTAVTLRLYTYGGASNAGSGTINTRIDDVAITVNSTQSGSTNPTAVASAASSAVAPGQSVQLTVTVTPGANPTSTGLAVTGDLSAIGGSSTQAFTAGANNTFTYTATVPANTTFGTKSLAFSVADAQLRSGTVSLSLVVAGNLTIFHTNDQHARVTPHYWVIPKHTSNPATQFELVGGVAYAAAKVLSLTAGQPDALVLDGGDISEGNPVGDWNGPGNPTGTYGNGTIVEYYKMLDTKLRAVAGRGGRGLDAMVVGNHDIRDITYLNNMKDPSVTFPIISINICAKGTHTAYFQPYVILNVDGHKIGVIGYTTESSDSPETAVNNLIDVVPCDWKSTNANKIHFSDIVSDLRNDQGCDLVILLTHDGHSDLCTSSGSGASATTPILVDDPATAKLPEIAITGHWHTYSDTVWQPAPLNYKTIFAESGSFTHYVGELRVDSSGKYLSSFNYPLRNADITPDPDIASFIQTRKDQFNATNPPYTTDQIVGYTSDDLLLDNYMKWWSADEYPWSGNNTAGNWICDAFQWRVNSLPALFPQGCDLSIESGGGVRSDIPAGPVTYTQIYETYPWADDTLYVVNMTGAEIFNYIQQHGCDVALSSGWQVTAYDGNPTAITHNGQPINPAGTYKVSISNYMYLHDSVPFSDPSPQTSSVLGRDSLVQFTATFGQGGPYNAGPSRYILNTDFSGGYRAVVMMMNDNDSRTAFDDGFIRLLSANSETLGHLGTPQVPASLVNADGSIVRSNRLGEIEMYRSYLGFKTGMLQPGDIIETYGKGSFFGGDPEFVDQEGIQADGVELKIVGHDISLAQPSYFSSINGFWNDFYKNHYVKFFAKKTAASQVQDQSGTTITIEDVTGFTAKTLPGNVGDLLVVTGVSTDESFALRFRCDSAALASSIGITGYPPDSQVNAVTTEQTAVPLSLTATAGVAPGSGSNVYTLIPAADAQVVSTSATKNYGASTSLFVESSATGFGNERDWLKFNLLYDATTNPAGVPAGATITSAKLNLFCWKTVGANLPVTVSGGSSDSWLEGAGTSSGTTGTGGIDFSTQPAFGPALDTQTLLAGSLNVWYAWDVTSFALSEFAGDHLVSLMVKAANEDSTDSTAPAYTFDAKEFGSNTPYLQITTQASGTAPTLAQVQFFYRYSADNSSWSSWNSFQTVATAPWNASFSYPSGYGYYEFYSMATDSTGDVEPAPAFADTAVHFTAGAITAASTNVTSNGATAQGTYNPYGVDTTVSFDYGTTTSYGSSTGSQDIGSGSSPVNFGAALSGLAPGTLYHVRAVIVSGGNTTYGADQTFMTGAGVPAMPGWGWAGLGGALLLIAARQFPRRRAGGSARVS